MATRFVINGGLIPVDDGVVQDALAAGVYWAPGNESAAPVEGGPWQLTTDLTDGSAGDTTTRETGTGDKITVLVVGGEAEEIASLAWTVKYLGAITMSPTYWDGNSYEALPVELESLPGIHTEYTDDSGTTTFDAAPSSTIRRYVFTATETEGSSFASVSDLRETPAEPEVDLLTGLVGAWAVNPADALADAVGSNDLIVALGSAFTTDDEIFPGTLKITDEQANSYIQNDAMNFVASGNNDLTITLLYKVVGTGSVLFTWFDEDFEQYFYMQTTPTNADFTAGGADDAVGDYDYLQMSAPAGSTYLVAMRFNATTRRITARINGGDFASGMDFETLTEAMNAVRMDLFGSSGTDGSNPAYLSNLLIYNILLTDEQVDALYNGGSFFNMWTLLEP